MNTENQANIHHMDLFESGKEGYAKYRIPGIVVTQKGTVIAYCEARNEPSDWAKIDILMRRSFDGGATWEERKLLVDGVQTGHTVNNPVMIASREDDVLHFLYCMDYATCYYCRSYDEGATWTEPVEITDVFERFKQEYSWEVIATGPCHGIQTTGNRLIVPVWLALDKAHHPSVVSTIYSDDNGDTWNRGELLPGDEELVNPNETAIAELSDGRILLNMRNSSPVKRRSITVSSNGYCNWSKPAFDEQLVDPFCCGGLVRYNVSDNSMGSCLLFSNCNDETDRKALTIRVSWDDGRTWTAAKLLYAEAAAYSDLAVDKDGTIYCYYERFSEAERYKYLTLARFNLKWLLNED